MIDIQVNGEAHRVATWTTLSLLVEQLEVQGQAVAMAVNRAVVPRPMWPNHVLLPNDQVDIVRAIGGG